MSWERALNVIPDGVQTLSKRPTQYVNGVSPKFLVRGEGCHVWDENGKEYIDFVMGLGAILLGYAWPTTLKAISEQYAKGAVMSLPHPLEYEVAELICKHVPCADMVRFAKNGSDVTEAAVRLARGIKGRDIILVPKHAYHGFHDWFACKLPLNDGIPAELEFTVFKYNSYDLDDLEKNLKEYNPAAITFEYATEMPPEGFFKDAIDLAHKYDALVIWDEVVTGFRMGIGGAQEYFGATPDLCAIGKGMGNGLPVSAVCGKREYMEHFSHVLLSSTFGGDLVSLAAAKATIEELESTNIVQNVFDNSVSLKDILTYTFGEYFADVKIIGHGPRMGFSFKDWDGKESNLMRSLFIQETVKRGILFGVPLFISPSHSYDDLKNTISAVEEAMVVVDKATMEKDFEKYMEGEPIQEVFRRH